MLAQSEVLQRIARLTPLAEVSAIIDALARPVAARSLAVRSACGLTLADDIRATSILPTAALALRDGWAVTAADILDASASAPVPLAPPPRWIETGAPLPLGADAVASFDTVVRQGDAAEAIAFVVPGEGVLAAGADAAAGVILQRTGARLRQSDIALLQAARIADVSVRAPGVGLVLGGPRDAHLDAAMDFLAGVVADDGGVPRFGSLDACHDPRTDAVIIVGGTGTGRRDNSVHTLARNGRVAVHGIAISPGETAAVGEIEGRPVLLVPGRIDCAIAVWLLLGRPLLARLAGGRFDDEGRAYPLSRKVSSALGLAEVIPVRRADDGVEPLASGYLSLSALAQADGWVLVPPESEGYPAGHRVTVRPLP